MYSGTIIMGHYDFRRLKVLVCDDSHPMRALITMLLSGFGIVQVYDAADAESGFELFVEMDFDLVITDWNMSPTNGLEFVKRIRKSPKSPNPYIPVVMLTGYTELYRVEQARDVGVSGFIAKPVSADALYKKLVNIVDDHRNFIRNNDYFGPDRRFHAAYDFGGTDRRRLDLTN